METQMAKSNHHHPKRRRLTLPLKTRVALFFINAVNSASRRRDGTVNRRLLGVLDNLRLRAPPDPRPRSGVATSDLTVDPSRNLWFRLFVPQPDPDSPLPVVLFFHGGGFTYLAPDFKAYDAVCRRFARTIPAAVISVNYRLAPENRHPAQYEDGFDVLRFLDGGGRGVLPENADVSRCFVAGDSAGGNIAHHVARRACESSSQFRNLKIIGVVAIQPFFGGEERTESETELADTDLLVSVRGTDWLWEAFMPGGSGMGRDHPDINVSGPHAVNISKLDFPATMVVVAGFDSLRDWQMRYYEWLKNSGKEVCLLEYPNMVHAFYVFPELPESAQLISEVKQFIHKQCSQGCLSGFTII